jgi:hypothetical protein
LCGFADEFGALATGGANYDGEAIGLGDGLVYGFRGGDGGFAPLTSAVEDAAGDGGFEYAGLLGVGFHAEVLFDPEGHFKCGFVG